MGTSTESLRRFPELQNFELEIQGADGQWSAFRAEESYIAARVLSSTDAVFHMLSGGMQIVENDGVRTYCRLTPKTWLER